MLGSAPADASALGLAWLLPAQRGRILGHLPSHRHGGWPFGLRHRRCCPDVLSPCSPSAPLLGRLCGLARVFSFPPFFRSSSFAALSLLARRCGAPAVACFLPGCLRHGRLPHSALARVRLLGSSLLSLRVLGTAAEPALGVYRRAGLLAWRLGRWVFLLHGPVRRPLQCVDCAVCTSSLPPSLVSSWRAVVSRRVLRSSVSLLLPPLFLSSVRTCAPRLRGCAGPRARAPSLPSPPLLVLPSSLLLLSPSRRLVGRS